MKCFRVAEFGSKRSIKGAESVSKKWPIDKSISQVVLTTFDSFPSIHFSAEAPLKVQIVSATVPFLSQSFGVKNAQNHV